MKKPSGLLLSPVAPIILAIICSIATSASISSPKKESILQSKERSVEKETSANEPYRIAIKSKGREVGLSEKFEDGDEDWLKNLQIEFKNTSDKPIISTALYFRFPEAISSAGHVIGHQHNLGRIPLPPNNPTKDSEPIFIISQDTVIIKFSDEEYSILKGFLINQRHNPRNLTKVKLTVETVWFSDGTAWDHGTYWVPDPTSKSGMRPIK